MSKTHKKITQHLLETVIRVILVQVHRTGFVKRGCKIVRSKTPSSIGTGFNSLDSFV